MPCEAPWSVISPTGCSWGGPFSGLNRPLPARIKGGVVLTAVGDAPDQALYWELVGLDPETQAEVPGLGSLKWSVTRTDGGSRTVNLYQSPTDTALAGRVERIRVRRAAR